MGYQHERDQALVLLAKAGFSLQEARQLLSLGTTLHRLAEAQCNGDWPWDNGEREVQPCGRCERGCHPKALRWPVGTSAVIRERWARYQRIAAQYPEAAAEAQKTNADAPRPICPDCRAEDRVRAVLAGMPGAGKPPAWIPYFQGDPRGCVLYIYPAGTPQDEIDNGRARGSGIAIVGRY